LAESAMNNALAQGVADTDEEKAYKAAKAEADSRAAQNRNNSEQGKSALDAVGYATQRREDGLPGSQGTIGFGDADGPNPAHGTSSHDPGQTLTSSGSFGPDGKPTGGRQLSASDVAEFKADWRKESPAQTDANIAGLKAAGYDTSGLEKFVNDYRNQSKPGYGNSNQTGSPIVVTGSRTPSLGERIGSIFGSIGNGIQGLWNSMTGGGGSGPVHSSSSNLDAILNPQVVERIYYPGSNGQANGAPRATDDPVEIKIVSGEFGRNTTQWTDMADFRNKPHYNGRDNPSKVDLAGQYANDDLTWFGPNASFRVDGVFVGERISGSRIQLSVLNSEGNVVGQLNLKHFKEINQAIYQGTGQIFPAGTYLGRTNDKVGLSEGPHLHAEITNEWLKKDKNASRNDIYNWMRGGY
ncbi:hypothetical protein, partial [Leptospira mayottensis]